VKQYKAWLQQSKCGGKQTLTNKNMSKKHYIKFANYIKECLDADSIDKFQAERMAEMIINCNDNPRFNKQRFLKACGLNS